MYEWILLRIDFIFEFNKTSYSVCLQMYLIMGQNMQVDKENKVSKDALQKSDGQLNRYMFGLVWFFEDLRRFSGISAISRLGSRR